VPSPFRRFAGAALAVGLVVIAAVLVVVWQTRDDSPGGAARERLTVFAAASLTDVLPEIDARPRYSFGGSNALATQIRNGAPADVFASANPSLPAQLHERGLVEKPVPFASNSLVAIVPRANPANVRSIEDLARPGVSVVMAAPGVPVGGYTLRVLESLGLSSRILPNVVSRETDVRAVLSKVALGQADAGFVYSTDAKQVPGKVEVVEVPRSAQPGATYAIAVVAGSPRRAAARAFVRELLTEEAQAKLAEFGFRPCPGCPARP
jgi:molybdate transport system substrate-binding protein